MTAGTARRWVPVDQLLREVDADREVPLPPRPRPVFPATDRECFELHPPHVKGGEAGQK